MRFFGGCDFTPHDAPDAQPGRGRLHQGRADGRRPRRSRRRARRRPSWSRRSRTRSAATSIASRSSRAGSTPTASRRRRSTTSPGRATRKPGAGRQAAARRQHRRRRERDLDQHHRRPRADHGLEGSRVRPGRSAPSTTRACSRSRRPRWTAYDAKRFGVKMPPEVPMIGQERAYTSPIWYTPGSVLIARDVMRLLREPLAALPRARSAALRASFALARRRVRRRPRDASSSRAGEIEHLARGFARTWQRPPTPAELDGLDRRLRARGGLLPRGDGARARSRRHRRAPPPPAEDGVPRRGRRDGPPPTDAELQAFLVAHPERYPPRARRCSFRQVFVKPRPARRRARATTPRRCVARLAAAGADADTATLGDPLMLPADLDAGRHRARWRALFGDAFVDGDRGARAGRWARARRVRLRPPPRASSASRERRDASRARRRPRRPSRATWHAAERKRMVEAAYRQLRDPLRGRRRAGRGQDAVAAR